MIDNIESYAVEGTLPKLPGPKAGFYAINKRGEQIVMTVSGDSKNEFGPLKKLENILGVGELFVWDSSDLSQLNFRDHNYGFGAPPIDMLKVFAQKIIQYYEQSGTRIATATFEPVINGELQPYVNLLE